MLLMAWPEPILLSPEQASMDQASGRAETRRTYHDPVGQRLVSIYYYKWGTAWQVYILNTCMLYWCKVTHIRKYLDVQLLDFQGKMIRCPQHMEISYIHISSFFCVFRTVVDCGLVLTSGEHSDSGHSPWWSECTEAMLNILLKKKSNTSATI